LPLVHPIFAFQTTAPPEIVQLLNVNLFSVTYPKSLAVGTVLSDFEDCLQVKYLGEDGENTSVAGAVAVCSPWDLLVSK